MGYSNTWKSDFVSADIEPQSYEILMDFDFLWYTNAHVQPLLVIAALISPTKSGCGRVGLERNSG